MVTVPYVGKSIFVNKRLVLVPDHGQSKTVNVFTHTTRTHPSNGLVYAAVFAAGHQRT